ncbi:tetratricopeptide repeat protein [Marinobacter sp. M216]|uniref:Tetratricopeptide repeat protein n=1 Tax=Marinobacter albus TaxID=3030833 RepID=A0ABT7HBG5_9GAMM|nr:MULTISPECIES: tetratricopeptide repeat protein [unclassified Marinobacter]MBW7470023.1 tetratricopeptide repeat protein [Marinobacter sp. F4218]MDK9557714.1 tetratricopeptide repeat protein [Marinobacter sp. M216]
MMMLDRDIIRRACLVAGFVTFTGCSAPAVQERDPVSASPEMALDFARQGKQAYEQGRKRAAEQAWRHAVELNPEDPVAINNLALLLQEEKRFAEAVTLLERGLDYSPDVAQLHYNLAVIAELYLLDLEKALTHYQRYREISGAEDKTVAGWIADLQRRLD